MPRVDRIYAWLGGEPDPEVDRTLAAALERAEPAYAERIVGLLFERRQKYAWAGLIANHERLGVAQRARLAEEPALLLEGLTIALRGFGPNGRRSALTLLVDRPVPHVAYMLAEALRDPSPKIREVAALALRSTAVQVLNDTSTLARDDQAVSPEAAAGRAQLVAALREAIRKFDLHHQVEVLEVCLWFATELTAEIWSTLDTLRSPAAYAITQHLASWNSPRLAGFLLIALGREGWRRQAMTMLNAWNGRSELLALLEHTDLLSRPEIRNSLRLVRRPAWIGAGGPGLADLPRAARVRVPMWIACLGYTEQERIQRLRLLLSAPLPDVNRAALYALAQLESPEAGRVLAEIAEDAGPLGQFAKWHLAGRQAGAGQGACKSTGPVREASR